MRQIVQNRAFSDYACAPHVRPVYPASKPVEERHRIDAARPREFLKSRIDGFRGPLQGEQFKGGQSNPTYRVTAGASATRCARSPRASYCPPRHAVDREFKVISALHKTGFPVARPMCSAEDDAIIGTPFYVMDCVEGRVLWEPALPGMSKAERGAIWDET